MEDIYATSVRKNFQAPSFPARPGAIHVCADDTGTHRLRRYRRLGRDGISVAAPNPKLVGLYRFTSLARPIDPAYLSNRALLIILPLLALLSAGLASLHDPGSGPLSAAFSGALVGFVAWALTRELAPDFNSDAFVALTLAWVGTIVVGMQQVLLVFVGLLLVRIVNRSTGLPSRPFDTLSVLGCCIWAADSTQQPMILLVASVAFALDATLKNPLRHHYFASVACLSVFIWMQFNSIAGTAVDLTPRDWVLIGLSAGGLVLFGKKNPGPVSYCDTSPVPLDRMRVNAGLIVVWLLAVQALLTDGRSTWLQTPVWICIFAVLILFLMRLAKGQLKSMHVD